MNQLCHASLLLTLTLSPASLLATDWNPLTDTGQSKCYTTDGIEISCPENGNSLHGQDASYKRTEANYQKNSNGTLTDLNSGLIWIVPEEDVKHTWQDALSYCEELVFAEQSNWRLPEKFELESIVDYGRLYPAINQNFSCETLFYWTATPHMGNPVYAWSVYCPDGADHWVHKTNKYQVRCVSSNPPHHNTGPYTATKHTVMDQGTGLEWQKKDTGILHTWQDALGYCEELSLDSKEDWRLPDIRELKSLVDYSRYYPATAAAVPCQSATYWSATTFADDSNTSAWSTFFGNGDDIWKTKSESHHVRCVRSD